MCSFNCLTIKEFGIEVGKDEGLVATLKCNTELQASAFNSRAICGKRLWAIMDHHPVPLFIPPSGAILQGVARVYLSAGMCACLDRYTEMKNNSNRLRDSMRTKNSCSQKGKGTSHGRRLISCGWSSARGLCFFSAKGEEGRQKRRAEAVLIAVCQWVRTSQRAVGSPPHNTVARCGRFMDRPSDARGGPGARMYRLFSSVEH